MTAATYQRTITVEGAHLHCEARGDGPPVLIIQGGIAEAGATEQLAERVAGQHRVLSYDRRGVSRSTVTAREPVTMARHAEDAAELLEAVSARPAHVVGASIGALIGLHLAARRPELVTTLVAHEPPMTTAVLDDEREAAMDEIAALAREDVVAAIQRLASLTGGDRESVEDGARPATPVGDTRANLHRFFEHDFPAVRASALTMDDVAAAARTTPVLPTGGSASQGQWEHRCAERLAQRLGRELIELPGGHNSLVNHPHGSANALLRLFERSRPDDS